MRQNGRDAEKSAACLFVVLVCCWWLLGSETMYIVCAILITVAIHEISVVVCNFGLILGTYHGERIVAPQYQQ